MEQLVFILIIAAVSLIKWVMEKSAELREQKRTEEALDRLDRGAPAPGPTAPPERSDDAVRKFMEALGLPAEETPPPPLERKPAPPPLPESLPERSFQPAPDIEKRLVLGPETTEPVVLYAPLPVKSLQPVRSLTAKRAPRPVAPPPSGPTLIDTLRTREGLRRAILAQEILGKPRGLVFQWPASGS